MSFTLTSPAFEPGADIPTAHTCDGEDIPPPLEWQDAPAGTRSFALVVDDPDAPDPSAPRMTWVHWVIYNLPPHTTGLPAGSSTGALPAEAIEGLNDWKQTGYRGPCPPVGRHRYFHKLYALDVMLPDLGPVAKPVLERSMVGHVLAEASLVGMYARKHPAG